MAEAPICDRGWKAQAFKDVSGNIYERERDGEWERWWLVTLGETARGRIVYKADLKKAVPEEHRDCVDRIEDFRFLALAITGLVEDAGERGLFPKHQLDRIQETARSLFDQASILAPAIGEPQSNGHA
jgi:hypothetical protein